MLRPRIERSESEHSVLETMPLDEEDADHDDDFAEGAAAATLSPADEVSSDSVYLRTDSEMSEDDNEMDFRAKTHPTHNLTVACMQLVQDGKEIGDKLLNNLAMSTAHIICLMLPQTMTKVSEILFRIRTCYPCRKLLLLP